MVESGEKNIGVSLPRLEVADVLPEVAARRAAASVLRESPALSTLADIVVSDPTIQSTVARFQARRDDFRAEYDTPGRSLAPYFAGIAHADTALLDAALSEHFLWNSNEFAEKLEQDSQKKGYSYLPVLTIGTGPHGQISITSALQSRPELQGSIYAIGSNSSVGGSFSLENGMDVRSNSRNRPQTDLPPIPGTEGNINPLMPGVMTPADMSGETYVPVKDLFGRPVAINHALHGAPIGLDMELESWIPDLPEVPNDLPGQVTAILRDKQSDKRYTVRSDLIVGAIGGGEERFDTFTEASQAIIRREMEQLPKYLQDPDNERPPRIVTHAGLYALKDSRVFPFEGIKKAAIIGNKDGAATAAGTLLGYEQRTDGSVMQVDRVKEVDWHGQTSGDDVAFLEANRIRYHQLAVDFPRRANLARAHRINPKADKVNEITLNEDASKAVIDGAESDLAVICTGFINDGEAWANSLRREPMQFDDQKIVDALKSPQEKPLNVGDTILLPLGLSVRQLQILDVNDKNSGLVYTVAVTTNEGKTAVGELQARAGMTDLKGNSLPCLGDYVGPELFSGFQSIETVSEAKKVESLRVERFMKLSEAEQKAFLVKQPVYFPSRTGTEALGLKQGYGYQVEQLLDSGDITLRELEYDVLINSIKLRGTTLVSQEIFRNSINASGSEGFLIVNEAIVNPEIAASVQTLSGIEASDQLDELIDKNAILVFPTATDEKTACVVLSQDSSYEQSYGRIYLPSDEPQVWAEGGDVEALFYLRRELLAADLVQVIIPNQTERTVNKEASSQPAIGGLTGEAFLALPESEQRARLQPGTVILTGNGRSDIGRGCYLINNVIGNNFEVRKLYLNFDTGFFETQPDTSIISIDAIRALDRKRFAVISNPSFSIKNRDQVRVMPADKDYVLNNLDELADRNAVIIGTPNSFVTSFTFARASDGSVAVAFADFSGFWGINTAKGDLVSWRRIICRTENDFNRIIFPLEQTQPVQAPSSVRRIKAAPAGFSIVTSVETGLPIAKKATDAPVVLVGPAAGLPVNPEFVRLIPEIPENTQSLGANQPPVAETAGRLALGIRPVGKRRPDTLPRRVLEFASATTNSPTIFAATVRTERDDIHDPEPSKAIRLGFGINAKRFGYHVPDEGEVALTRIVVERSPATNVLVFRSPNSKRQRGLLGASMSDLLDNEIILRALDRLLTRGTDTVEITLPFDHRGLQVRNIQVIGKRTAEARPPKPKIPQLRQTRRGL